MANIVHIDNEDSENSIIEIEAPKKPAPLVIDLADEEIIINVKADIPSTPLSPGVPWVSQYDNNTGNLGVSIEDENDEENKENINIEAKKKGAIGEENGDVGEEENEDENDEATEDENGGNGEGIKKEAVEESEEEDEDDCGAMIEVRFKEDFDKFDENDETLEAIIEVKTKKERGPTDNKKPDEDNDGNDDKAEEEKVGKATEAKNNTSDENEDDDKQVKEKKEETKQGDKGREDDQAREDIQSQPGPSSFDPHVAFSQSPYSLTSLSHSPFPRSSVSRPPYLHNPYELMTANPPREDPGPHHPEHWTPEMVKFYDEDWGNEKEFVVEKLQEGMDKDPSLWEISSRDVAYWKNKDKKPAARCYNCFDCGHESYDCPEEERVPKCHMCGTSGHIAYKCPDSLCLNCGTATTGYVTKCKNCTFGLDKVCERCNLTGHIYSECTDHWRLYHSTVGTKRVDQPRHDIYKSIRNRWCCNCGRQGHLQVECDFCVKNCEFSDTLPFVSSYIKAFTRGSQLAYGYEEPEGPKRLKIDVEDNIMTNPSQKHVYQRKTSQLRNKLKSLARDAMMRNRDRSGDRRRHQGGGFNRFSFF